METFSEQDAAERIQSILKQCVEEQQRMRVETERGNVVLLPEDTYEQLMLTLEWLATTSFIPSDSEDAPLTEEAVEIALSNAGQLAQ